MKFKLVIGSHSDIENTYQAGDVVESEIDLVAVFGEKFQSVSDEVEVRFPSEEAQEEPVEKEVQEEPVEKEVQEEPVGEDVTNQFDVSNFEDGLKVFKRKRKYFVCIDGEEINQEGLSKKNVLPFVSDYFG
jgi:hypothetical protein